MLWLSRRYSTIVWAKAQKGITKVRCRSCASISPRIAASIFAVSLRSFRNPMDMAKAVRENVVVIPISGKTKMQFDDVILGRRSIRGYKPDPVPAELIREILALAMRAPSSMNTQPWNFYVITGAPLDRIRRGNTERNLAGVPHSREFRIGQPFAGVHRERQIGVAKQLFSAMEIARDDKERRQDWVMRGFRQFDAPVCVIITYDRVLASSDDTAFDCGAVATALVNAAWSRGLGAVINSQGIMQSPVVREHAGIADDQVIMKSIALGWPDDSFPANAVVSERKSVEDATTFVGFGG
jgi:nitroreductase